MRVVIVGGGPAGYVAAIRASQLGLNVTIIEEDKYLGGTCLHRGCIPTKVLLHSASLLRAVKVSKEFGLTGVNDPSLDLTKVQERKRSVVRKLALGIEGLMKKRGVEVIHGRARLCGLHKLEVDGSVYEFDKIILATGSRAAAPAVFGVDGEQVVTSDHLLNLEKIPQSMIVVGAGAVGMELASFYSTLGTKITIVDMADRLLPLEDEEISAEMQRVCRKSGWKTYLGVKINKVEKGDEVTLYGENLDPEGIKAEILLVAAGRRANLEDLGLESVGLQVNRQGRLEVDSFYRTAVEDIYAVGDIIPSPQLAHMASHEAILAVEHIAGLRKEAEESCFCPAATYSYPEVASVGLTEAEAKKRGLDIVVGKFPLAALGKAAILGESAGFYKVVARAEDHLLLGVHIIGVQASELISEATIALKKKATLEDLAATIHAHPALAESCHEAVEHALGTPLNFMPRESRK